MTRYKVVLQWEMNGHSIYMVEALSHTHAAIVTLTLPEVLVQERHGNPPINITVLLGVDSD